MKQKPCLRLHSDVVEKLHSKEERRQGSGTRSKDLALSTLRSSSGEVAGSATSFSIRVEVRKAT